MILPFAACLTHRAGSVTDGGLEGASPLPNKILTTPCVVVKASVDVLLGNCGCTFQADVRSVHSYGLSPM